MSTALLHLGTYVHIIYEQYGLFIDSFLSSFLQGSIWTDMESCFSDTSQHVSMLDWACEFSQFKLCSIACECLFSFIENTATLFRVGFRNIDYLGSTKIGFRKQFVPECKGCFIAFKDRLEEDRACFELLFYHERQSLIWL